MKKTKYKLANPRTKIHVGDCRKIMAELPASTVDLVFADPPFNWQINYDGWDDNMPRSAYLEFTEDWLDACIRCLSATGSLWINIADDTAAEVVMHLKKRGLDMVNWCVWHFRFGQCRRTNFIVSKYHALYFARHREKRVWNPETIMEPSDRASVYGDTRTQSSKTPGRRVPLDVWYGPNWGRVQGNNTERRPLHPNQLPEIYLERIIRACSNSGDLILDPFCGSGTTNTVARALGRRSIGIEINPVFAASARKRIQAGPVRITPKTNTQHRKRNKKTDSNQLNLFELMDESLP